MTTQPITLPSESRDVNPHRVYLTGMYLGLAGILMFFTGLISAWVVRKGLSTSSLEAPLELPRALLGVNTFLFLASSAVLEIARRAFRADRLGAFRRWWYAASVLGIAFLTGQVFVLRTLSAAGVFVASNPDAGFFYIFTAAHGIFLLGGISALLIVAARNLRCVTLGTAVSVAGVYWHFLTALWCAIFVLLTAVGK